MKSMGEIYFDSSFFTDDASKTIGLPAVGPDTLQILTNRRNAKGKLNQQGQSILKNILEKIQSVYEGFEISVSWDKNCGCSLCPCSPGFRVKINRDIKSNQNHRFTINVNEEGKIDFKEPTYLFEVGIQNIAKLKSLLISN